jgi:hypothetical protein
MSEIHQQPELSQEEILERAIERLSAGESLDAILTSSGSAAEWLEPMLIVAAGVRGLRESVSIPPPDASLAAFLAQAERIAPTAAVAPRPWWERLAEGLQLPAGGFARLATTAVATLLVVLALTLGSAIFLATDASAAQNVLPGQPLYPIKRLGEEMILHAPQSSESRDAITARLEMRRLDEVQALQDNHIAARVEFQGEVEDLSPSQIVVSGITLMITDDTQIAGPLADGARVFLVAHTMPDGPPIAQRIVIVQPAPPTPTPSPTATPTRTPGATPTPTATATFTSTPEPTATQTPPPTDTPDRSASDTREPTTEATSEPPPEDGNQNENENQNEDENGGEDGDADSGDPDNGDDGGDGNENNNEDHGDGSEDGGDGNQEDGGDNSSDDGHEEDESDNSDDSHEEDQSESSDGGHEEANPDNSDDEGE